MKFEWCLLVLLINMLSFNSGFAYIESSETLYEKLNLRELGLRLEAFDYALKGFDSIKNKYPLKNDILAIADFTQSSAEKRLFVIDLSNEKLLFNTWVAHGVNSGNEYATSFSNTDGSKQTSLGFYLTAESYEGSNGISMRLEGLEPGVNDNARDRYIVMHGAWYVSQKQIDKFGRIGRSWGCPAVPLELAAPIINTLKDGTVLLHFFETI